MSLLEMRTFALTALIGSIGAIIGLLISFPAPFLIGPAVAVTLAGVCGLRLAVPVPVRNACFIIVGISMGATVTPDVFIAAKKWPLSFVIVLIAVVILIYASAGVLRKLFRYDRTTALLASSPGHLAYVLSVAAETRCDLRTVSVSQSTRVLMLTITTPILVEAFDLAGASPAVAVQPMSMPIFVLTLAAAVIFGLLFRRWKFPAALLLGGMLVALSSHITGFVSGGVPDWLLITVYVILGSIIGSRFSGVSIREIGEAFIAGVTATVVVVLIAGAIASGVSYFLGVPLAAALIAFAPGGLETMAAMAVMLNADPTYVGAHHILRLLFLSVLIPFLLGKDARRI